MDWSTVLVSVSLGAVVGTLVSLIAVPQTTYRQRRAERRDQARQDLLAAVAPFRAELRKFRHGANIGLVREQADLYHGDDYVLLSRILEVSRGLGLVRRILVRHRLKRVFGAYMFRTADVVPDSGTGLGSMTTMLVLQYQDGAMDERFGTLHWALTKTPDSVEVNRLETDVKRLAAGW